VRGEAARSPLVGERARTERRAVHLAQLVGERQRIYDVDRQC
jgi:hypothetical protein